MLPSNLNILFTTISVMFFYKNLSISADLDLDSLMELLDDNEPFEHESSQSERPKATESAKTPEASLPATNTKEPQKTNTTSDKIPVNKITLCDADMFSPERPGSSTENIPSGKISSSNPNKNDPRPPQEKRRQVLKSRFKEDLLNPQKVENPKKDEVYEKHPFNKKESALFNFGEMSSSDEETEQEDKEFLTETGKLVRKEIEAKQLPSYHEYERKPTKTCKFISL